MISELFDLVAPRRCFECGAREVWCAKCRGRLTRGRWVHAQGTALITPAAESPGMMRAISQWKDLQQRSFTALFAELLLAELRAECDSSPVQLMVVPSRRSSVRKRGYAPMVDLMKSMRALGAPDVTIAERALIWTSQPVEQRELSDVDRDLNVAGKLAVEFLPEGRLVLVEDVVTSGATLREALRAVSAAGRRIDSIVALAVPRHNLSQDFVKSVAKPLQRA